MAWAGFSLLRTGTSGGCFEHNNETSGSVRGGKFLG